MLISHPQRDPRDSLTLKIIKKLDPNCLDSLQNHQRPTKLSIDTAITQLGLIELIGRQEKESSKGYIGFEGWMNINEQIWGVRVDKTAQQLWKMLRLINKGQILIPTGLAYQIVSTLVLQQKDNALTQIIESFLLKNSPKQYLSSFRELKNYPSFQQIQQSYSIPHKEDTAEAKTRKSTCKKINKMDFKRLTESGRDKQNKVRQLRYNSIAQQLNQCSFRPSLCNYKAKNTHKYTNTISSHPPTENTYQQVSNSNFKATKIRQQIFEGSVQDIPGAKAHIGRHMAGECERLRIQRYLLKPKGTLH